MRYNRLKDIGLTEQQIKDNLMFATDKIGDTMTVADDARPMRKAWFGAVPPDLSVEARVRGTDWLYNYLLGFYRDDEHAHGLEQPRVPERRDAARAVGRCTGPQQLGRGRIRRTTRRPSGAAIASKGLARVEPAAERTSTS